MTKYFKATIEVLIEGDDDIAAADALGGLLTDNLQKYRPDSSLIDWQFDGHFGESDGEGFYEFERDKDA